MTDSRVVLITGTSKGIGADLVKHFATHKGESFQVVGCSRREVDYQFETYEHYCLDVVDEVAVKKMFSEIQQHHGRLDILINNAGIASMNHCLLTPLSTVRQIYDTNVIGTFLFCREAAKLMQTGSRGRIVNFATVATPLRLEGEAIYASSKAAVESLTQILARELAEFDITVNAVGPTPVKTDLIRSVPQEKMQQLIDRQAIRRYGEFKDIQNVIDFFILPESDFITGQVMFLGGI
jgi:3-oxoacyl-[acyl-carrier protein] reductase